ncbi:naringenin-chalcone synthase [Oscillatoria sp. FACHB-1407]|uniref:type III polyketide synthase n=1 Tax=Oscillatoria sp. FACHB-1407 TaxID=2692847 RepID=UPI001685833A|nr:3-oxoacyl-[acyl-carrier-protein] synthase III C-terminal domain-containing protein [Oscillatoria sp. FACHB-1407]MBD2461275.1 naringenin-chalcone synthase [Oscillatoria sp. FACHB-1407]
MNANVTSNTQHATFSPSSVQSPQSYDRPRLDAFAAISSKSILPTIESIATGTPDNLIRQADAAKVVANLPRLKQHGTRIEKIYNNTRIDTRHLALDLLSDEAIAFSQQATIQARMQMYEEYAVPLAERVARKALASANTQMQLSDPYSGEAIEDAIHLIVFVSSTGFIAPGIDTKLIKTLGLRRDIARVPLHFMGCAAAMNGLRVASDYVRANPAHKALVICLELSSVNAVFEDDMNDVIIHSIFGDGCAAVVIGACEAERAIAQGKVVIRDNFSYLVEDTEDGITLGVNDNGITCRLSRHLPDYIELGVRPVIERFLQSHNLTPDHIDLWAVHPGGTRIIEKVQSSLNLSDRQVAESWEILRQYGNMLSASILFVLEQHLFQSEANTSNAALSEECRPTQPMTSLTGLAFSFSPGVGIEGLLFQKA